MTAMENSVAGKWANAVRVSADQVRRAAEFRNLHVRGTPLLLVNAWDAGSAKVIARSGAKALATSSWALAAANGMEDGERVPRALAIENLRSVVSAVDLPVSVDLESGYGDAPEVVGQSVALAIDAGAVGCNLEDSFPANGKLRQTADQVSRIHLARRVAHEANLGFFINARTDVFFQCPAQEHYEGMVEEARDRAHAYAEAGADGLFAPGLVDIALIARLAETSPLPLNVMVVDTSPPVKALAQHGVARVSFGPGPYLLAMKALEDAAVKLLA
jgi:2-methylisocitrate lyase-like PEP mutase family enzyme